jgi:cathepsin B
MQMQVLSFIALIAIIAGVFADPLVLDQRIIARVNAPESKATWTAGENSIFKGKKMSEVQHMLGAFLVHPETMRLPKLSYGISSNDVPTQFDAYTNWPQCAHPVRDQAQCGSCWAFSASESLTDRFCIAKNDGSFPILSPQDMVSCDHSDYGCQGGYLTNAWKYLENTGIVTDACMPYKSGGGFVPSCPNQCDTASTPFTKYQAKSGSTVTYASVVDAQQGLMQDGPFQVGFSVYQDFFSYTSGVYSHVSGGLAGGHAVLITGWGVESGTPYWLVKNSWASSWGMNGYFKIKRGNNECGVESQMIAGIPQM